MKDLEKMSLVELEEFQTELEDIIRDRQRKERMKVNHTNKELVPMFTHYGIVVPDNAKFWRIHSGGDEYGCYGLEVGSYTHSCHIDTTDIKVLLLLNDEGRLICKDIADFWLKLNE